MNCSLQGSSAHGDCPARILEWVAFPSSRGSAQPRDQTQVSHIAGRFFTNWATREAKNTKVGSLFLLQGNFPTQESNRGLLHLGGFFTSWATREILKQGGEGIWGKKGREIIICKGPVGGPEGQFGGIKVWWPPWSAGHDEGMEGHCKRIRWGGWAQSLKAVRSSSRLLPWLWE